MNFFSFSSFSSSVSLVGSSSSFINRFLGFSFGSNSRMSISFVIGPGFFFFLNGMSSKPSFNLYTLSLLLMIDAGLASEGSFLLPFCRILLLAPALNLSDLDSFSSGFLISPVSRSWLMKSSICFWVPSLTVGTRAFSRPEICSLVIPLLFSLLPISLSQFSPSFPTLLASSSTISLKVSGNWKYLNLMASTLSEPLDLL